MSNTTTFTVEQLNTMVQECHSWNGSLEAYHAYDMDMFDEAMSGNTPTYIAERIFFGDFNPNHDYFRFNGYGNLESLSAYDYEEELKDNADEIVETFTEMVEDGSVTDWNNMLEEAGE